MNATEIARFEVKPINVTNECWLMRYMTGLRELQSEMDWIDGGDDPLTREEFYEIWNRTMPKECAR